MAQAINYLIFKKMKKSISLFFSLASLAALLLASCKKEETPTYSSTPIESISVTSGDETVAGVVDDAAKSVSFTFNNAESFSSCNIDIKVNDGWTLTFPKTLTGVDLQSTPTLNFTDPDNAIVKYSVKFSSNAFPIVDASKIQIEGLNPGEAITVDNASKTITIKFSEETMDFGNITLIFNEGALQSGVTVPEDLSYDFSQGNSQALVLNLGGERVYSVVLDVSDYLKSTPEQLGFLDVTSQYALDGQDYLKVYAATAVSGLPVPQMTTYWDGNWSGSNNNVWALYGVMNPRAWEILIEPIGSWSYGDYNYDDDLFSFPGNWKEDRTTMNCFGDIVIVTLDAAKVKADIVGTADGSADPAAQSAIVTTTGWTPQESTNYLVKDGGAVVNAGIENVPYRASMTVNDGTIGFVTAAQKSGAFYSVPFQS